MPSIRVTVQIPTKPTSRQRFWTSLTSGSSCTTFMIRLQATAPRLTNRLSSLCYRKWLTRSMELRKKSSKMPRNDLWALVPRTSRSWWTKMKRQLLLKSYKQRWKTGNQRRPRRRKWVEQYSWQHLTKLTSKSCLCSWNSTITSSTSWWLPNQTPLLKSKTSCTCDSVTQMSFTSSRTYSIALKTIRIHKKSHTTEGQVSECRVVLSLRTPLEARWMHTISAHS